MAGRKEISLPLIASQASPAIEKKTTWCFLFDESYFFRSEVDELSHSHDVGHRLRRSKRNVSSISLSANTTSVSNGETFLLLLLHSIAARCFVPTTSKRK